MEPPKQPRRKSSASENDESAVKTKDAKSHRKSFVVGTKGHHSRVPSYGKKLNQLGKLTALTSTDGRAGQDCGVPNPQRRGSFHRSASQKSLTGRRNGSAQDVRKLHRSSSHHGSTTRLTGLKAMTKVETKVEMIDQETSRAETLKNPAPPGKRPTFVIEDDDGEESDEHTLPMATEKIKLDSDQHLNQCMKENSGAPERSKSPDEIRVASQADRPQPTVLANSPTKKPINESEIPPRLETLGRLNASHLNLSSRRPSGTGLLYPSQKSPIGPQVFKETVVSRDIQIKDRPQAARSSTMLNPNNNTPANSQPLTSRFLESPRRNSITHLGTINTNTSKDIDSPALQAAYKSAFYHHSPHGSTTNLGGGASRTQQKLLLQRASSIHFDGPVGPKDEVKSNGTFTRGTKEIERIAREYKNVKRFRDPVRDLSYRLYSKGFAMPNAQPLRRTMTSIALANDPSNLKSSAVSKSSTNLKQQHQGHALNDLNKTSQDKIDLILSTLWSLDDYDPTAGEH